MAITSNKNAIAKAMDHKPTTRLSGSMLHHVKPGSMANVKVRGKIVGHSIGEYGDGPSTTMEVHDCSPIKDKE